MRDFRVINAKAILPISKMVPVRGFAPISVMLIGDKLDRMSELFYNGVQVDEYIIQAPNRVIARVPESQLGRPFREVSAYAEVALSKMDAAVQLSVPHPLRTVAGMDRLVQTWVLVFLTTPGTDIFSPASGGGARSFIGKSTDRNHMGVSSKLAFAIERTKAELLRSQSSQASLPLSERLLSCNLEQVSFDSTSSILNARVSLSNMLGNQAQVSIG